MHIRNLLLGATLVTPTLLPAQEFYRPEPEVNKNELTIGLSVTSPIDISFKSGGYAVNSKGMTKVKDADGNEFIYSYEAPTGNVLADNTYYTVTIDDNGTPDNDKDDKKITTFNGMGTEDDPGSDGKTSYFSIVSAGQLGYFDEDDNFVSDNLTDSNKQYYIYQANYSASLSEPVSYQQEEGYNPGIDVSYTRYLDDNRHYGIVVGFTSHGADSNGSERQNADITEYRTYYKADFDNALVVDDDHPTGSYSGVSTRPAEDSEKGRNLIYIYEDKKTDTVTVDGAVQSDWDVEVGYYNLRLGGQYQFDISRKWSIKLAGGFAATYVDSKFKLFTQVFPTKYDEEKSSFDFSNGQSVFRESSESDIIYGGWGSADIVYNINQRVSWSIGASFMTGDTYEQRMMGSTTSGEDLEYAAVSVDIGNTMSVKSAVSFRF